MTNRKVQMHLGNITAIAAVSAPLLAGCLGSDDSKELSALTGSASDWASSGVLRNILVAVSNRCARRAHEGANRGQTSRARPLGRHAKPAPLSTLP
jgi:hypothetical protein